ncbi:hypothetical protein LCGC14_1939360, partial [marine sediment metagenome]
MVKYKVLYFEQAPWKVGEAEADRDARITSRTPVISRDLYPESYPGQVISVVRESHKLTPADLADPARKVVTLDLTEDERAALA